MKVGDVWVINLGEDRWRSALVIADPGGALVTVCAMLTKSSAHPFEVPCSIEADDDMFIRVDAVHAVSRSRLTSPLGHVPPMVLSRVRALLRLILLP
jgi:mRNA-degrading endonuclease toxin of MazEF toxin-antitoxin module